MSTSIEDYVLKLYLSFRLSALPNSFLAFGDGNVFTHIGTAFSLIYCVSLLYLFTFINNKSYFVFCSSPQ